MRFPKTLSLFTVLILCPQYAGPARLDLLGKDTRIRVASVRLNDSDPRQLRVGALTFLGGITLASEDETFGGFSSLTVQADRFTLLSDGGNIVRFRMSPDFKISNVRFGELPAGPRRGWQKNDRDSESMTRDAQGNLWVGFERYNMIWRYRPGFSLPAKGARPSSMSDWPNNGGAESLVRLKSGRFLVIGETASPPDHPDQRIAIVFDRDPVETPRRGFTFAYKPPGGGYDPSDATQLPDGRIIVLNRDFSLPFRWRAVLTLIDPREVKAGAVVSGREIARFAAPLTVDNYEGVTTTREGMDTILWLVSDDNQSMLERTLLMKFRLDLDKTAPARAPGGTRAGAVTTQQR